MFLRSVKAPNGRHEYLRLVESFREGDKVKQRIVAHLGRDRKSPKSTVKISKPSLRKKPATTARAPFAA